MRLLIPHLGSFGTLFVVFFFTVPFSRAYRI